MRRAAAREELRTHGTAQVWDRSVRQPSGARRTPRRASPPFGIKGGHGADALLSLLPRRQCGSWQLTPSIPTARRKCGLPGFASRAARALGARVPSPSAIRGGRGADVLLSFTAPAAVRVHGHNWRGPCQSSDLFPFFPGQTANLGLWDQH